jgi:hypothetical protein
VEVNSDRTITGQQSGLGPYANGTKIVLWSCSGIDQKRTRS